MPIDQSDKSGVLPGPDKNAPTPTIPADHQPQTPEYLMKLVSERNELQVERDKLWADRYGMTPRGMTAETKPAFQEIIEYERKSDEIDRKIDGLTTEINNLRWIVTPKTPADLSSG